MMVNRAIQKQFLLPSDVYGFPLESKGRVPKRWPKEFTLQVACQ